MKDFNYYNTFITIAPDSAAAAGTVPAGRGTSPTAPQIQYELLAGAPYTLTQEALYYHVHLKHKGFSEEEIAEAGTRIFDELFARPQACMRTSALPKKYGWGIHFDEQGRIALYGVETPEYARLAAMTEELKVLPAMRSSRKP